MNVGWTMKIIKQDHSKVMKMNVEAYALTCHGVSLLIIVGQTTGAI